jgi:hypothetical protein
MIFMFDWPHQLWYSLAAIVVLLLPGLALLVWLPKFKTGSASFARDGFSVLADTVALSIAVSVVLGHILFLVDIQLSAQAVIGLYLFCLIALIAAGLKRLAGQQGIQLPAGIQLVRHFAWGLALGMLILALVLWRFYQARNLALPAWVDPVHHTLVVRIFYEYGGVPSDFLSYFPAPFYYHYGFHLIAALFAFWSRLPAHDSVLWFGQVVNAAVALSVYRAAYIFTMSAAPAGKGRIDSIRWQASAVGISAVVLVGFVFQMPAYYLSWGRYTMLTGLILLGPTLAAIWEAWHEQARKEAWLRVALLMAAMCLTHYFILLLVGLFLVLVFFWGVVKSFRFPERRIVLLRLVFWCTLGVLVASPWLWRVLQAELQSAPVRVVTPFEQDQTAWKGAVDYLKYIVYLIGPRHNHILMGMAGAALLASLRRPHLHLVTVWALLLTFLSSPWGLRFSPFRPDHFAIVLFFPAAVLLADLLVLGAAAVSSLAKTDTPWPARVQTVTLVFVLALFVAWGLRETNNIVNPVTMIGLHSDAAALEWVKENTPPDARFYINSTPWIGATYRGVDGGYWLLPYTGRASLLPPSLYVWGEDAYVQQVKDLTIRSTKVQGCTPDFWDLVRDGNLTYIYLRQGVGNLQPEALENCPRLNLRYQQDGVFIYEINRP